MIIIFGIRRFTIKSYSAAELGLTDPSWNGVRFEFLQQYFHLMFIPFFPVGKMTGTRGADGKLYHLTPQMQAYLNAQNIQHKTPWYSFIGLMLVAAGVIFSLVSSAMSQHNYEQLADDSITEYKTEALNMINYPSVNDYYKMKIDTTGGSRGFIEHQVTTIFHVDSFTNEAIRFSSFSEQPFAFSTEFESLDWSTPFNDSLPHRTFWLKKNELRSALIPSSEKQYTFNGARVQMFDKTRYVVIQSSEVIDGPKFVVSGITRKDNKFSIDLTNKADTASDIRIAKMSGEGEWIAESEPAVGPGEVLTLLNMDVGQLDFSIKIVCFSPDGKGHSFLVTGSSSDVKVKRLN